MDNGISIYPGLDNTLAENLQLLEMAANCGLRRVFTSLHIPETNIAALKKELAVLLQAAKEYDMEIISDISPRTMEVLDIPEFRLEEFQRLGINTLRLDYGFEAAKIAELSHNEMGIRLQINASTITEKILSELQAYGTDFSRIDALHNFYPRQGTGLGETTLCQKNAMLKAAGIKTGAFVSSQGKKRGPLFEGLPTLEAHRQWKTDRAARHMVALGIDSVFLSESLPSEQDLQIMGHLHADEVVMEARFLTDDHLQQDFLKHSFTARVDEARDAIRAQESRQLLSGTIMPDHNWERWPGAITIDNKDYLRYMGEVQVIKTSQPPDKRVNVAGWVTECELFMLKYITPGRKFSFKFI